ncbi:hypothetical protein DFH27DRAFT_77317 [Peziza echinospora]|nr:hypothetical protein DFH27DRAFT_77317 [Peziza echinospora]
MLSNIAIGGHLIGWSDLLDEATHSTRPHFIFSHIHGLSRSSCFGHLKRSRADCNWGLAHPWKQAQAHPGNRSFTSERGPCNLAHRYTHVCQDRSREIVFYLFLFFHFTMDITNNNTILHSCVLESQGGQQTSWWYRNMFSLPVLGAELSFLRFNLHTYLLYIYQHIRYNSLLNHQKSNSKVPIKEASVDESKVSEATVGTVLVDNLALSNTSVRIGAGRMKSSMLSI